MPITQSLKAGTRFMCGGSPVELAEDALVTFTELRTQDEVAEVLAASAPNNENVALNLSELQRQDIIDGVAVNVSYGPGGVRGEHSLGEPPGIDSLSVEDAAPTIVVATFTEDINSAGGDYDAGVSIEVDGVAAIISSSTRQSDNTVVHYTLSVPVGNGEDVTFSYDASTGDLASDTGAYLQDISDEEVTNNVEA